MESFSTAEGEYEEFYQQEIASTAFELNDIRGRVSELNDQYKAEWKLLCPLLSSEEKNILSFSAFEVISMSFYKHANSCFKEERFWKLNEEKIIAPIEDFERSVDRLLR